MANRFFPNANIHTPEEILENAKILFETSNPRMMRAAILEAITALEAYVQYVVFLALGSKYPQPIVDLLDTKTRLDFDSRLSVLVPIATGLEIKTTSSLWVSYKKAKQIRNQVTHTGSKVSSKEAKFVINTVEEWLAYLASTAAMEIALVELKRYIETNQIPVKTSKDAEQVIAEYFGRTSAAINKTQVPIDARKKMRVDVALKFQEKIVIIETKLLKEPPSSHLIERTVRQVEEYMNVSRVSTAAVVLFTNVETANSEKVRVFKNQWFLGDPEKSEDGNIYVITIVV